jgi:hypothetical protein
MIVGTRFRTTDRSSSRLHTHTSLPRNVCAYPSMMRHGHMMAEQSLGVSLVQSVEDLLDLPRARPVLDDALDCVRLAGDLALEPAEAPAEHEVLAACRQCCAKWRQTARGDGPAEAEDGAEVVRAVADVDDPVKIGLVAREEGRELVACMRVSVCRNPRRRRTDPCTCSGCTRPRTCAADRRGRRAGGG